MKSFTKCHIFKKKKLNADKKFYSHNGDNKLQGLIMTTCHTIYSICYSSQHKRSKCGPNLSHFTWTCSLDLLHLRIINKGKKLTLRNIHYSKKCDNLPWSLLPYGLLDCTAVKM